MGVYRSLEGKECSLRLYDEQIKKLNIPFDDVYVVTSFGKTHLVETGNRNGKPLLVFHGGNSTTAYNLLMCKFLLEDFHIYAVDIIGHPGKSDEGVLSHRGYDYGKWAAEVIDGIGYDKIACFGGSYGAGVLSKLMCVSPQKIERSVLVVPSGINNALPISQSMMMLPLVQYRITKKKKYLVNTALYMSLREDVLDNDTLDIIKDSFDNVKTKVGMPTNINKNAIHNYAAPTMVIAADKDCLFPAKKVLPRARELFKNCETYVLKNSGHIHIMPEEMKKKIINFLDV
ncbi:MAG: alpha/beta hydrolase [Ruminococcus sp.]|nr:alpha/beta hydrolase [Ruminococcus sp.]